MADSSVELAIISASELLCGPGTESEEVPEQKEQPFLAKKLTIPDYQRIYSWGEKEIKQLWQSIKDAAEGEHHHTGSVILYDNGDEYEIVDGQQRLITLSLILYHLEKNKNQIPDLLNKEARTSEEETNVANAHWVIENLLSVEGNNKEFITKLLKLQFTTIIIPKDDPDLAYVFFNNQNTKGEQLTDFDLLKAHHLRFIVDQEESTEQAKRWIQINPVMEGNNTDAPSLRQALGVVVYRLRQIMRKNGFNENGFYIRDEYQSAQLPNGMTPILPFDNEKTFYSQIQGGTYFFEFAEFFYEKYRVFLGTAEYKKLRLFFSRHRHLYDICECFLFAYFLKFGDCYLPEALFCICAIVGKYRYGMEKVTSGLAQKVAFDSNLIYFIIQSQAPAYFIGEALLAIDKIPEHSEVKMCRAQIIKNPQGEIKRIQKDFYDIMCRISGDLNIKVGAVREKMKTDYL